MQRPRDHKDTLKIVNNSLTIYGQRIVNNPLTISKHLIIKTIEIVRILYCGRRQAPFQSQNMPQVTADIFVDNSNKFGLFTRLVVGSFLGVVMPSPEKKPYSVDCHL